VKFQDDEVVIEIPDGTVAWPKEQDICPDTLYMDSNKVADLPLPRGTKKGTTCY